MAEFNILETTMKTDPKQSAIENKLLSLKSRFEDWRRTREKKGPIPDDLWDAAISIAKKFGVAKVALELRLDYNKLKRLSVRPELSHHQRNPEFIEVTQPYVSPVHQCDISIRKEEPGKVHVQIQSTSPIDLSTILNSVWR